MCQGCGGDVGVRLTSPVAGSFLRNALSSMSLPSLSIALWPISSSLITSIICATVCANLCLSSSNSAGDRANSPWCTWNVEQQLAKEKTVRVEELINPASRASLEDKPSVRGGRDCKEVSWSGGDSGWSWDIASPRNRFSSQRKVGVCEEAGSEPETYLRGRERVKNVTKHNADNSKTSVGNMKAKTTLCQFCFPLRKVEVESCWCYFLIFHQSGCPLGIALQRKEVCHMYSTRNKKWYFTHIMSYSYQGILCQQKSSICGERLMLFLSALCTVFPLKYTQTRTEISMTKSHKRDPKTSGQFFFSFTTLFIHNRPFFTCVLGCSDWLVKVTSRFSPVRGLSNAKSRTGFSLSKGDCGRSKVNLSAPLSPSSATCTDGENKTSAVVREKTTTFKTKMIAFREHFLPPAGCRSSSPSLWFLFVSLASSNKTEPDE